MSETTSTATDADRAPLAAPVDYHARDGVATITLNAPETRNVLNVASLDGLLDALTQAATDDEVRLVVLTATGRAFCAGADLSGSQGFAADGPQKYVAVLEALQDHPKPVLARVQGHVAGGGNGLVAASDIAVAVESAKLAFSEVRVGVVPAVVAVAALRLMPPRVASELFLTGQRISADQAVQAGLLTRAVADEAALDAAVAEYVDLLRLGGPTALRQTKEVLRQVPALGRDEAYAWARDVSSAAFSSAEAREGMTAFAQRRSPSWVQSG